MGLGVLVNLATRGSTSSETKPVQNDLKHVKLNRSKRLEIKNTQLNNHIFQTPVRPKVNLIKLSPRKIQRSQSMEALNVSQIERWVTENDKTEETIDAKVKNIFWKNLIDFHLLIFCDLCHVVILNRLFKNCLNSGHKPTVTL